MLSSIMSNHVEETQCSDNSADIVDNSEAIVDSENSSHSDTGTGMSLDKLHVFVQPAIPIKLKKISKQHKPTEQILNNAEDEIYSSSEITENSTAEEDQNEALNDVQDVKLLPIPYKEPSWSGAPPRPYSLEVHKGGIVISTVMLDKPFLVFGRLEQCDVTLEHPSISRFHCIVQYRAQSADAAEEGVYVYDLGSTHGSYQNKYRLQPRAYNRVRVGHMLKFGRSSRTFLLMGPSEDVEEESALSVKELQELASKKKQEKKAKEEEKQLEKERKEEQRIKDEEEKGISWGMGPDAVDSDDEEKEQDPDAPNPFSGLLREELFLTDPKKSLRGWYEREGYDLPEYDIKEVSSGHFKCTVTLPVLTPGGEPMIASVDHRGKKKDTVVQAALEACRLLDRHDLLRQAKHASHERHETRSYDSDDEDEFLDRTGDVARKKDVRSRTRRGERVFTYQELSAQHTATTADLHEMCDRLMEVQRQKEAVSREDTSDDLDTFMRTIVKRLPDKHKTLTWKIRCTELRKTEARLRRLVNIARPAAIAELLPPQLPAGLILPGSQPCKKKPAAPAAPQPAAAAGKRAISAGVHKAFLEEDEQPKLKLTKLDSCDDNVAKPVPYEGVYDRRPSSGSRRPAAKYVVWDQQNANRVKGASPLPSKDSRPISPEDCHRTNPDPEPRLVDTTAANNDNTDATSNCDDDKRVFTERISQSEPNKESSSDCNIISSEDPMDETGDNHKDIANNSASLQDSKECITTEESDSISPEEANIISSEESNKKEAELPCPNTAPRQKYTLSDINSDFVSVAKKARIVGPTKPTQLQLVREAAKRSMSNVDKSKASKKKGKSTSMFEFDDPRSEEQWTPPSGQTGDGKTHLNAKLGY